MPVIPRQKRELFRLLKVARGQEIEVTIGTEVTIAAMHWTPSGPRPCQNEDGKTACPYCADKTTSTPRDVIYCSAYIADDDQPWLLIMSAIAVQWAHDTEDLVRSTMLIRRATKNNLLRATKIGPAQRGTPPARLSAWLDTLWGSAK